MKEQYMFQDKFLAFANKGAVENNPILAIVYAIAYPLALLAKKIHLRPNIVTLFSFIFALLAFLALVFDKLLVFILLWLMAYILDFVDGTLARMTGQIDNSALDLDHISDVLKIVLIFLGFALYFNDNIFWILSFLSSSFYVLHTLLNHELGWVLKFSSISENSAQRVYPRENDNKSSDGKLGIKTRLKAYFQNKPIHKKIALIMLTTITTIHGHTLLIFFFIPLDLYLAYTFMLYFLTIIIYRSFGNVVRLKNMKRVAFVEAN